MIPGNPSLNLRENRENRENRGRTEVPWLARLSFTVFRRFKNSWLRLKMSEKAWLKETQTRRTLYPKCLRTVRDEPCFIVSLGRAGSHGIAPICTRVGGAC